MLSVRSASENGQSVRDVERQPLLHEIFEKQVDRHPDAPAVIFAGREASFADLAARRAPAGFFSALAPLV